MSSRSSRSGNGGISFEHLVGDALGHPLGAYQGSAQRAFDSAARYLKEGGAQAVKLEGGQEVAPAVRMMPHDRDPGHGASWPDPAERARARRDPAIPGPLR